MTDFCGRYLEECWELKFHFPLTSIVCNKVVLGSAPVHTGVYFSYDINF